MTQGVVLLQPEVLDLKGQSANKAASKNTEEFESVYQESVDHQVKVDETTDSADKNLQEEKVQEQPNDGQNRVQETKEKLASNKTEASEKIDDTVNETMEKIKEIVSTIKELQKTTDIDIEEMLEILLNFLQSNDMEVLTQFIVEEFNLESSTDLIMQPDIMDTLNQLKSIATGLQELVASGVDLNEMNLIEMNDMDIQPILQQFMQKVSQSNATQSTLNQQPINESEVDNIVGDVQVKIQIDNVATSQTNQDTQMNSDTKEQSDVNSETANEQPANLFLSKLNTIEVIRDRIVESTENNNLEQLLKQEIVQQIVNRMSIRTIAENTSITLRLKPEHLGNLVLSVSSNKGNVIAQFVAENSTVKEAIEMNLFQLKTTLEQQGINVDEIEVSVANNEYFDQKRDGQPNHQNQRQNNRRVTSLFGTADEDEIVEENIATEEQHIIDYSA